MGSHTYKWRFIPKFYMNVFIRIKATSWILGMLFIQLTFYISQSCLLFLSLLKTASPAQCRWQRPASRGLHGCGLDRPATLEIAYLENNQHFHNYNILEIGRRAWQISGLLPRTRSWPQLPTTSTIGILRCFYIVILLFYTMHMVFQLLATCICICMSLNQ